MLAARRQPFTPAVAANKAMQLSGVNSTTSAMNAQPQSSRRTAPTTEKHVVSEDRDEQRGGTTDTTDAELTSGYSLLILVHRHVQAWVPNMLMNKESTDNASSDTDTSTDMDSEKEDQAEGSATKSVKTSKKVEGNDKTKEKHCNKNKQLRHQCYKVTPTTEPRVAPKSGTECRNLSAYSFSSSLVLDDMGRRVTTMRRRYEDSTGRPKAVHEREIDGKKLRTTWRRQSKEDEGRYESMCSSGSPEGFEALWQQTPFGEAQKRL